MEKVDYVRCPKCSTVYEAIEDHCPNCNEVTMISESQVEEKLFNLND